MSWKKLLANLAVSAGGTFIAFYQTTGSVKVAAAAAGTAAVTNVAGLVQRPPQEPDYR